jgi:hypothetical protein
MSPKQRIDILVQQYSLLRGELLMLLSSFKSQGQYLQIVAAAAVGVIGFVMPSAMIANRSFWIALMFLMTTVVGYIVFTLLETLYAVVVLGAVTSVLEDRINHIARENSFIWESKLAAIFYSPHGLRPGGYFAVYQWLLIAVGVFGLPAYYTYYFLSDGYCEFAMFWCLVGVNLLYGFVTLFFIFRVWRHVLDRDKLWASARSAAECVVGAAKETAKISAQQAHIK